MRYLTAVLLLLCLHAAGQQWNLKTIDTHVDASFRGLSVVDNEVAWVSGTNGTVGISTDGGLNWHFQHVKNFEKSDFRSLYAFDAQTAVIASAGTPSVVLRTTDGGLHWNTVYKDDDTSVFFDGTDFWNRKDGMIYGDPINGRMYLLVTHDGGRSWHKMPLKSRPGLEKGEASFAASGTGIRCIGTNKLVIVTGGMESRFFISEDRGITWRFVRSPVIKGKSTTGIFSVACQGDTAVVVGGDYKRETLTDRSSYVLFIKPDRFTWRVVLSPTGGYRECAEFVTKNTLIAVGPTGADISRDIGVHWRPLADEKDLHTLRKSRKGKLVLAAGSNGKICRLVNAAK